VNATLDDDYLEWLEEQVGPQDNPQVTHKTLLKALYSKEFVWVVPNDDNRCLDGIELRDEFMHLTRHAYDNEWMLLGCSVLEMLVALSRRLSFEAEGEPREWFWHMIKNLELDTFRDPVHDRFREIIDAKLEKFIWRQYDFDGVGGLFPLENPREDQRKVEIWYQLGAYILELELERR